jgi:hypothetical protein
VSILPGIYASQITGHLVTGSYESIATYTVGAGGVASIEFTGIPSTFKHLQLRAFARSNYSGTGGGIENYFQLGNGSVDTGANYTYHYLLGNGGSSTTSAAASTARNDGLLSWSSRTSDTMFSPYVTDILDYANTSKYKTVRTIGGNITPSTGQGQVLLVSSLWQSTSAVTNFKIYPISSSYKFDQYSSFALYGIKGA